MPEKYYIAAYTGEGFITHEDQEKYDLKFQICAFFGNVCLVLVDYTDDGATAVEWSSRVLGMEKTYAEAQAWGTATTLGLVLPLGENFVKPPKFELSNYSIARNQ